MNSVPDPMTLLFCRWRDQQDNGALASLFDQAAPDLLRVALHLARGPVDAEDLLQQTFLVAMESAASFDAEQALLPWMTAILRHRASNARRRSSRELQADSGTPQIIVDRSGPADHALSIEAQDRIFEAMNQLPDPIRQPTLLHLRHGLAPAEIAHVLTRSPGTVRVQLHRGLKQLRRLLPLGLSGSLAALLSAPRGLAMIRTQILRQAETILAASQATTLVGIGGFLVTKKILGTAAALLFVGLLVWSLNRDEDASSALPGPTMPVGSMPARAAPGAAKASTTVNRELLAEHDQATSSPPTTALRGLVRDGVTRQPVAGATIAFYRPQTVAMDVLRRRFHGLLPIAGNGSLHSSQRQFLDIPTELPFAVLRGRRPHPFTFPPEADAPGVCQTTSDAEGRFVLDGARYPGGVRVTADGFGQRFVSLMKPQPKTPNLEIDVYRPQRLRGQLVDARGQAHAETVRMVFCDASGLWPTRTDANGAFEITIAAPQVTLSCPDQPGQLALWRWQDTAEWRPQTASIQPEQRLLQVQMTPSRSMWLHLTDKLTGKPIDFVTVLSKNRNDRPFHCGRFFTKGGYFLAEAGWGNGISTLVLWTERHAATAITLPTKVPDQAIEIALVRGGVARTRGMVLRHGLPLEGARVRLRSVHHLNQEHDLDKIVDQCRSDEHGAFVLTAPAGRFLLEVLERAQDTVAFRQFRTLPVAQPMRIDLAEVSAIDVLVVDEHGQPAADFPVAVKKPDRGNLSGRTDATGRARLQPLTAGIHKVFIAAQRTEGSYAAGQTKTLNLVAGTIEKVRFQLVPPRDITLRLRIDDPSILDFAGWRVTMHSTPYGEAPVSTSGEVQLRFASKEMRLAVEAPDGRRWKPRIPRQGASKRILTLTWPGLGYTGTLSDERGRALAGARIQAYTGSGELRSISTRADEQGRFTLLGLDDHNYVLSFSWARNRRFSDPTNPYRIARFHPKQGPGTPAVRLDLRVPALDKASFRNRGMVKIHGQVRSKGSGQPARNTTILVTGQLSQDHGRWSINCQTAWTTTDDQGRFECTAPETPNYRIQYRQPGQPSRHLMFAWTGSATLECNITAER